MSGPSAAQRRALSMLAAALPDDAYLAGGVAVALRLGHRVSHDLDLFVQTTDPLSLEPCLLGIEGTTIDSRAPGTLYVTIDGVPTSILSYQAPLLEPTSALPGIPVPVASLVDLGCMKLAAISQRGAARDFWDLHEILRNDGNLAELLGAFRAKYPKVDVGHVIRSLAYFGDAETEPHPRGMTEALWARVRADIETRVRAL